MNKMKEKLEPITALAKIRVIIQSYYEEIGREGCIGEREENELIQEIDEIVQKVDIPTKNLIIEKFQKDEEENEEEDEDGE